MSAENLKQFKLNIKQLEAQRLAASLIYFMLFGGSRSGKTFIHIRNVIIRAIKAPGSRHCILRFRFNHIKSSIIYDTFPKVMRLCFPDITYRIDKVDWRCILPNGSEIWFGGLDDKERTEKILGNEYATIYLCECSQISWQSVGLVITRLAQKVVQFVNGVETETLTPRMFFDCNPPNKLHWTFLLFIKKVDPETKLPLSNPNNYGSLQVNPLDNAENLSEGYIETLKGLSARLRKRFLDGEFADAVANALFPFEIIDRWRNNDTSGNNKLPNFVRVVIAVDPSGADDVDNSDNDAIGIVVIALGVDGNAYVLEDLTVKAGPATWGRVATQAFDRHKADCIVAETNFGGAMVQQTIQISRPRTPFRAVTASRGKVVRAEPFSALYEEGKVRHVGMFNDLEDELGAFTTAGYVGPKSPNRADALIWGLSDLYPAMTKPKETVREAPLPRVSYFTRKL